MAKQPTDPEGVGYGRPPTASQFKPGKSGNPRGRPKGSGNLSTGLIEAMNEKVTVTENGKSRKLPKCEVIAKQTVHKAASGDLKAISMLLTEQHRAQGAQEAAATRSARPLDANDDEVFAAWVARIRRSEPPPSMVPPSDSPSPTSDRPYPRKRHVLLVRPHPTQATTRPEQTTTSTSGSPPSTTPRKRHVLLKK